MKFTEFKERLCNCPSPKEIKQIHQLKATHDSELNPSVFCTIQFPPLPAKIFGLSQQVLQGILSPTILLIVRLFHKF